MSDNPFLSNSLLNIPLQSDTCQQIHYTALRSTANESQLVSVPARLPLEELRERAKYYGPETYLESSAEIERIFSGITLVVYQKIQALYCDRLERSINVVWRIISALAQQAGNPGIDYEAVWAICGYLKDRRAASCQVAISYTEDTWWLVQFSPNIRVKNENNLVYQPAVLCILDSTSKVLSFRLHDAGDTLDKAILLAIYDVLVSQRQPDAEGAAGLVWQLPQRLTTESSLSEQCQQICARIGFELEFGKCSLPILTALHGDWTKDLANQELTPKEFARVFDHYLWRVHGYGPLTNQAEKARLFSHLMGYNRDPAWQFPMLRQLLPLYPGVIAEDGAVEFDGLHYSNDLLSLWVGCSVTLRQSALAEAVAWIYLDGEILCQAVARELQRKDGSYLAKRPRRW
jgi:hypothetical protein